MIKAVIIDDSEKSRNTLKKDIKIYCPEITLIGEASGVVEGAKLLKKENPDLVFLDIQMGDGDGFDLLDLVREKKFKVIFTTASDAHAIRAIRFSALDYLLKPIDPEELKAAVKKMEHPVDERKGLDLLMEHMTNPSGSKGKTKKLDRIALHSADKIEIVELSDIVRLESRGNYTMIYLNGKKDFILVTTTLGHYDELLSGSGFFRVHQSHLVNTRMIKEFVKAEDSIRMTDKSIVPVSTRKRAEVLQMLENL
jgi:two-component system, LytTR family, response regulator